MQPLCFTRRRVLVTGASSGLGREMARRLARDHQADLILVARRLERLETLKAELEQETGVRCQCLAADLARPGDVERVFEEATAAGEVYAVILNAGVTHFGPHAELSWADCQNLLATNVSSVVQLVSRFVPYLLARGQGGGILLVSSMAGLLPVPYQAAYAGSKAFITNFGLSLAQELRGQAVSLTVFCPGGIDTEMTRGSRLDYFRNTALLQDAPACAAAGLAALSRRDELAVPGVLNKAQLFATRLAPRRLVTRLTGLAYRRALEGR